MSAEDNKSTEDKIDEMTSRLRRIETRQIKIAEQQGIDVTTKVRMFKSGEELHLVGRDVSIANLVDFLRDGGIRSSVVVVHGGERLITVQLI